MGRKKKPQSPWKTLVSIVVALLLLLFTYFAQEFSTTRLPASGTPAEFYSTHIGDDLRQILLAAIGRAESSITLAIFTLSDAKVIQALRQKAEEGVETYVVVDAKASPKAKRLLGPKVQTVRRTPAGLMHLKLLVIDHRELWVGSANMTYESLRIHGNLVIAAAHPELAQWVEERIFALPSSGHGPPEAKATFALQNQEGEFWLLPNPERAVNYLHTLISQAQESLQVAMFTWTRPDLTEAIIQAHRRGVKVRAFIDRRQGEGVGAETVYKLRKAGVPVALNGGTGLLHDKLMLVDGKILVSGSANWTRAAFKANDDCFFVLTPLTEDQQQFMRQLFQQVELEAR